MDQVQQGEAVHSGQAQIVSAQQAFDTYSNSAMAQQVQVLRLVKTLNLGPQLAARIVELALPNLGGAA